MSEQLQLLDGPVTPPDVKLTARQRKALDTIAAHQPIRSDELGAYLHPHGPDKRCDWCTPSGREVGEALKRKGLVEYEREAGWKLARNTDSNEGASFGAFPPGF